MSRSFVFVLAAICVLVLLFSSKKKEIYPLAHFAGIVFAHPKAETLPFGNCGSYFVYLDGSPAPTVIYGKRKRYASDEGEFEFTIASIALLSRVRIEIDETKKIPAVKETEGNEGEVLLQMDTWNYNEAKCFHGILRLPSSYKERFDRTQKGPVLSL